MAPGSRKRVDVTRDIVVIGASAGGVEALTTIVEGLAADFPGAVHLVLHLAEGTRSFLPDILARASSLPVYVAGDREEVRHGAICVAPPDRHLVVEDGHVRALRAPKADGVRPSADILFQSAALAYGPRVVGVVLTGALSDGTLGLQAIKRRGGVALVQSDALHRGMPRSAIRNVDVDFELPLREIAPRLTMLVEEGEEAMSPEQTGAKETELDAGCCRREAEGPPA
jgi:two-component system chemotaxis response regulator CheB